ncbi:hypothetical protein Dimus_023818 [Dionaea muscipula]
MVAAMHAIAHCALLSLSVRAIVCRFVHCCLERIGHAIVCCLERAGHAAVYGLERVGRAVVCGLERAGRAAVCGLERVVVSVCNALRYLRTKANEVFPRRAPSREMKPASSEQAYFSGELRARR